MAEESQVPDLKWADPAKMRKEDLHLVWELFYERCFKEEFPIIFKDAAVTKREPQTSDDVNESHDSDSHDARRKEKKAKKLQKKKGKGWQEPGKELSPICYIL